jgi:hypothetical protein
LFGISAACYDACLAIETKLQMDQIFSGLFGQEYNSLLYKQRHKIYHFVIFAYNGCVVIWMNADANNNIGQQFFEGGSATSLCWIRSDVLLLVLAIVPVWTAIVIISICNVYIVVAFYRAMGTATHNVEQGIVMTVSNKTKMIVFRLMAIPIIFIFLWLPSSTMRVVQAFHSKLPSQSDSSLNLLYACAVASTGIFNAIFYILLDSSVRNCWWVYLLSLCGLARFAGTSANSSFAGPSSVADSDMKLDPSLFRPSSFVMRDSNTTVASAKDAEPTLAHRVYSFWRPSNVSSVPSSTGLRSVGGTSGAIRIPSVNSRSASKESNFSVHSSNTVVSSSESKSSGMGSISGSTRVAIQSSISLKGSRAKELTGAIEATATNTSASLAAASSALPANIAVGTDPGNVVSDESAMN